MGTRGTDSGVRANPVDARPFQANRELLRRFLAHREEIVESVEDILNAQRKPIGYLQDRALLSSDFEDCFLARAGVTAGQTGLRARATPATHDNQGRQGVFDSVGVSLFALNSYNIPVMGASMGRNGLFLLAAMAAAQAPNETVFRTGTQLVQISVVAQDKDGQPVSNLHRDDFQILDNGRPQNIRLFLLQKPDAAGDETKIPGIFTNRLATARTGAWSVLLFDNLNIDRTNSTFEHTARARIKAIAALQSIPPGDEIAIYALNCPFQLVREFTTDRDSMLAELKTFAPTPAGCLKPDTPEHSALDHLRDPHYAEYLATRFDAAPVTAEAGIGYKPAELTLARIDAAVASEPAVARLEAAIADAEFSQIADHLAGIPGRKNLLWITTTFRLTPENLRKLINAGVVIYPIDTLGSTIALDRDKKARAAQLAQFAAATGGKSYTDRDDLDVSIEEAFNDGRTSYILGFYRPDDSRQASIHQVAVRVNRPGITLRYRTSYSVEPPPQKPANPVRDLVLAMNRPVEATAVGISVSAKHAGTDLLNLGVGFDISTLNLEERKGRWTGQAEFVARFETIDGKQAGHVTARTLTFRLKPATYASMLQRGYLHRDQLHIPPRAAELNVAISSPATGAIGTVRIPLPEVR